MNAGDLRIAAFLEQVLETVVETFTEAEVELPPRRYIFYGTPAMDCAQVTVSLQQLYLGSPGVPAQEPVPCSAPTSAVIRVEVLRDIPIPTNRDQTVPAEKLAASARDQIRDAEILIDSVAKMCGRGWGGMGVFADLVMGTETGGVAGPVLTLTAGVP